MMNECKLLIDRINDLKGDMSNRRFAAKCGLTEGVIRNILKGGEWDSKTLKKIARECGKPLWWFFSYEAYGKVEPSVLGTEKEDNPNGSWVPFRIDPSEYKTVEKTLNVIRSETVFSTALDSNVMAFDQAVKGEEELKDLRQGMEKIMETLESIQKQNKAMAEKLGMTEPEKKRAGNSH